VKARMLKRSPLTVPEIRGRDPASTSCSVQRCGTGTGAAPRARVTVYKKDADSSA